MLLEWSDDYSIGIRDIDDQHKVFLEAVHRLYDAILESEGENVVEETLEFLKDYANKHFEDEESLMQYHNYPGLGEHKKLHDEFLERFEDVAEELRVCQAPTQDMADNLLAETQDWLVEHIAEVDAEYVKHVRHAYH